MKRSDFYYDLPEDLIAFFPTEERTASRLLCVNPETLENPFDHLVFLNVIDQLKENDLLVLNNTKVIPARLNARKPSGGKVEIMIETILSDYKVHAYLKSSKSPKIDSALTLMLDDQTFEIQVVGRADNLFILDFSRNELQSQTVWDVIEKIGHMPLPPYIKRDDEAFDQERYQTVFAQNLGAVAAPTAGLHFDETLLKKIKAKGVDVGEVTLHVGAGTFQPVRVDDLEDHHMHSEYVDVDQVLCDQISLARSRGGRIVAVGTTVVRCLETASMNASLDHHSKIKPFKGNTNIFIYPGYEFHCVDMLLTNFHLSESTLLMLVSAFSGVDVIKKAYQLAIEKKYRFYSYGDAMLLKPSVMSKQKALNI